MTYLSLLAFVAGGAITIQAMMNAQLGQLLKNALLATSIAFASSLVFMLLGFAVFNKQWPQREVIQSVPHYLWFSGGLLSAFAVAGFYWLIPKMGIGPMMSYALTGQLLLAIIAGHFGWFQSSIIPISPLKLIGAGALVLGIILINHG
ncbi:MAG: DMT family transporter [Nitrospirae bacterium]|nr:DMT family transporter [Candidatus Manganitrophaceae bacterium]